MKKKFASLLVPIAFATSLLNAACVRRVHDYTFAVTGYVTTDDGSALQDVEVVLQVEDPVYAGVTAIKTERILSKDGGFVFMYLTGSAITKYTVTVSKDGFESQTVAGSSPPAGHHTIRLRKIATRATPATASSE